MRWEDVENYGDNSQFLWKTMFIGEYIYSIDEKRRMAVPPKFRKDLNGGAVLTRGIDTCLSLYPTKEWQKLAGKLESLPAAKEAARGFARILLSGAVNVDFDKLGRILIPDYLKKYAGLKKNVTVIGLGNRIEVWDQKIWETYKVRTETQVGSIAEKLEELGI